MNHYKHIEKLEIAPTDAVVNPGAVMVVSVDTVVAEYAVTAPRCPQGRAVRT